jgi:hypothetical protein
MKLDGANRGTRALMIYMGVMVGGSLIMGSFIGVGREGFLLSP